MKVKEQYRRKQRYGSVLQRRRTLLQQRLAQIGYIALRSSHPPQLHGDITRWASTSELAQRRSTGLLPRPRWLTYLLGCPNLGFPNRENLTRCSISGEAGSDESQSYDYRLDLTATALRAHRGARRTVRGFLRWYSTARTARRRRRPVAWTDRLCGTGCTVTTPKGWPDFVISSSRRAPDRSSRRGSGPS